MGIVFQSGLFLLWAINCSKPDLDLYPVLEDFDGVTVRNTNDLTFKGVEEGWG